MVTIIGWFGSENSIIRYNIIREMMADMTIGLILETMTQLMDSVCEDNKWWTIAHLRPHQDYCKTTVRPELDHWQRQSQRQSQRQTTNG